MIILQIYSQQVMHLTAATHFLCPHHINVSMYVFHTGIGLPSYFQGVKQNRKVKSENKVLLNLRIRPQKRNEYPSNKRITGLTPEYKELHESHTFPAALDRHGTYLGSMVSCQVK